MSAFFSNTIQLVISLKEINVKSIYKIKTATKCRGK
jgi:hypothetical protein